MRPRHKYIDHKYRSTMQQKLVQHFFTTRSWRFGNSIGPKLKNIFILYIYLEYLLCPQANASGSFLLTCIIL